MNKMLAEFIGTFTLVFLGCGSAVLATVNPDLGPGLVGISLAFGLALIGMAYGIGAVSGCHINPAVSLGAMLAGRMDSGEMFKYWGAQVGGAIVGALMLVLIMSGKIGGYDGGYGANGWGEGYLGEYGLISAFIFEIVATFLFVVVILGSTGKGAATAIAGLGIGLMLVVIHIVGINVTGVSVNPARSIGPALFSGGTAMAQLWLFIVAPMIGGAAAGILFKTGMLDAEEAPETDVKVDAKA
jgi:aquaporin Z